MLKHFFINSEEEKKKRFLLNSGYSWSDEEDKLLVEKYIKHGHKWSFLKTFFPNRTPNDIKNRFNYTIYHQISILKEFSNSKH